MRCQAKCFVNSHNFALYDAMMMIIYFRRSYGTLLCAATHVADFIYKLAVITTYYEQTIILISINNCLINDKTHNL